MGKVREMKKNDIPVKEELEVEYPARCHGSAPAR
jgi:hypothetical protein